MILGRKARKVLPKRAKSIQVQKLAQEAVLSHGAAAKKRSRRNPSIVGHSPWRNLKGLVRRQAANTSLNHDQGSILLSILLDLYYFFLYFDSSSCLPATYLYIYCKLN